MVVGLVLTSCSLFTSAKKSGCEVSGDCKSGEVCLNHVCKAPDVARCGTESNCSANADCASMACESGCCLKACASQGECPVPLECDEGACRQPVMIGCSSDADCAASQTSPHCDTLNSFCVPCVTDDQCPANSTCTDHACVVPVKMGCDADVDCADPLLPHCLTGMRVCVSCLDDGDCRTDGGSMICNKTTNACEAPRVGCATDSDCNSLPATPHCRVGDSVCVQCTIPQQCTNFPADTCYALNTCGPVGSCGSDADCLTGDLPYCATDTHKCVACVDNSACSPGFGCGPGHTCIPSTGCTINGNCSAPTPVCHAASGACVGCLSNINCGSDGTCTDTVCHYPPPPLCQHDSDCPSGKVCAAAIYPHDDTHAGNLCVPRNTGGSQGPGALCSSDSQCRSGLCLVAGVLGYCQGGCTTDAECPGGPNGMPSACTTINLQWDDSTSTTHYTQVSSCVIQCAAELDCYPYGTCLLSSNVAGDNWVTHCDPNPRSFTSWGGAECTTQSDCGTSFCIKPSGSTKGYCAGLCGGSQGVANCAPNVSLLSSAVPSCPTGGVQLRLPNGTSTAANVCWGPTCSSDSDCPVDFPFGQWKCRTDNIGRTGTGKFCHPP
jgi:hypothetical protein